MANYFDQFDAAPPAPNPFDKFDAQSAPAAQANYFDKFDAPAEPAAPVANDNPFDPPTPVAQAPDKPEDSWLQTGLDTLKQIPGSFEKAAGGMLQAVGNSDMELPAGVGVGANDPEADAMASFNTQAKAGLQSPAKIGASISQAAQQSIVANAPNVPDGSAKYYANTLGIGIGQMLPALMGSLLTHSAAPIIAQTAAVSFGNSYADAIAQNPNDPDAAAAKATGLATIDTAAAAIGIKAFGIQPFASVIGKITNEATGEFASVTQQSISDMIKNLMLQGIAVQPAIAVVNRSVDNWVNGKPITEGLGDEYVTGALQNTLIMGIGHMASQPKPTLGKVQAGEPGPGSGPGPIIDGDFTPKGPGPAPAGTPQIAAPIDPQFVQPGDEDSPIPTSIIAAGRQSASEAGTPIAQDPVSNDVLVRNGWPSAGTPVNLDDGVNPPLAGTIHSGAPDQTPGGTNDALNVQLDSGHMLQTFRQEIEQAGVTITPQQAQQAGLPLDIATNSAGTSQEQPQPQPVAATSASAGTVGPENAVAAQTAPQPVSQGMPVDLFQPNNSQVVIPPDSNNTQVVAPPAAATVPALAAAPPPPAEPVSPPAAVAPPTTGDGTAAAPIEVTHPDHVEQVAPLVNTAPTPAQAHAGNYQKAHLKIQGLPITIENPKGSVRSGVGADGQPWSVTQPAAYGYIKRSTAADGEQVDAYVGPNPQSSKVFVIDQKDAQTGAYDEAKSFVGFDNKQQALDTYHAAFSDGLGPQRMGGIREMNTVQFKKLLNSGALDKPVGGEFKPGPAAKEIITSTNQTGPSDQNSTPEEITPKAILKAPRAPLAPSTETSVLENIRRLGGVKILDNLNHPTKEGQDVLAALKDVPRLGRYINNQNGMRPDAIREDMQQNGWFGRNPEDGADIQHLYDLIDKEVREGPQYHPESEKGRAVAEKAAKDESDRQRAEAHDQLDQYIKESKELFSPAEKAALHQKVDGGFDPLSAVVERIENKATRDQYEHHAATSDQDYRAAFAPDRNREGAADSGRGQGLDGHEAVPTSEGDGDEAGVAAPAPMEDAGGSRPAEVPTAEVKRAVTPRPKLSIAEKLAQRKPLKESELQALYNAYFKVGNVIDGYGGRDVVTHAPTFEPDGRWQVGVREVEKDGTPLVGPAGRQRFHSTAPKLANLLAVARSPEFQAANPTTTTKAEKAEPPKFSPSRTDALDGHGNVVPQTVIPGAEGDAVQLAKAREAAGKGKSTTSVAQKSAGGMFGEEPKEPEQGALFRPGDGATPPTTDDVDHLYTPKFDEVRQHVADTLRAELDRMGLHDIALTLPDALSANGQGMEGVFADRAIHVALSGPDPASTFDHEAIHAFKALGLFTKSEWSILDAKATRDWRRDFDVDNRWKGLGFNDADFNEEAIAEAYRNWRSQQGLQPTGLIARIFNKLRDALGAIKAAFTGRGFKSPEDIFGSRARDIFGKVADGKVGRRPRGEASETAAKFSPDEDAEPRSEADKALDAYIGARAREMGWEGEPTSEAMYRKALFTPKGPLKTELSRNAGLIKTLEDQRTAPFASRLTPNKGDGETKVHGASQGSADMAAKRGHAIDGELPTYDASKQEPLMKAARKFVADDANQAQAEAVAMGLEPAPYGQHAVAIRIALEDRAAQEGNVALLNQIATKSKLNEEATTAGQNNAMYAQRDPHSAAAAMQEVQAARQAAAKAKGTDAPKAKKDAVKDMLDAANKEAKAQAKKLKWETFIQSIKCSE